MQLTQVKTQKRDSLNQKQMPVDSQGFEDAPRPWLLSLTALQKYGYKHGISIYIIDE